MESNTSFSCISSTPKVPKWLTTCLTFRVENTSAESSSGILDTTAEDTWQKLYQTHSIAQRNSCYGRGKGWNVILALLLTSKWPLPLHGLHFPMSIVSRVDQKNLRLFLAPTLPLTVWSWYGRLKSDPQRCPHLNPRMCHFIWQKLFRKYD